MTIRPLSSVLEERARLELNEDPKKLQNDLRLIKDWLAKQPHLRARNDDQWLAAFLRGSKYSLERTKEKLDLYYSIRSTAPDLHRVKHDDTAFSEILDSGCVIVLPETPSPGSPRVAIIRPGAYDPSKYNVIDVLSVGKILEKLLFLEDDDAIIAGVQIIIDLKGVSLAHYMQMTPTTLKKMVVSQQDAIPIRMKGTHYLNTPSSFEPFLNTLKYLLNEKNKNRLHVHNKQFETLYKYISQDILPAEYGGKVGTIKEITDIWKQKVQKYHDWLEEDLQYGTDESKRFGKPKTAEEMFGIDGSFRQLEFD